MLPKPKGYVLIMANAYIAFMRNNPGNEILEVLTLQEVEGTKKKIIVPEWINPATGGEARASKAAEKNPESSEESIESSGESTEFSGEEEESKELVPTITSNWRRPPRVCQKISQAEIAEKISALRERKAAENAAAPPRLSRQEILDRASKRPVELNHRSLGGALGGTCAQAVPIDTLARQAKRPRYC